MEQRKIRKISNCEICERNENEDCFCSTCLNAIDCDLFECEECGQCPTMLEEGD